MNAFGELVNKYREARGINIKTLAENAQLSTSYVSLLIRGEKIAPSAEVVAALAKALDLTNEEHQSLLQALTRIEPKILPKTRTTAPALAGRVATGEKSVAAAGVVGVYTNLVGGILDESILNARKAILIQDTWLPNPKRYKQLFLEAAKRNRRLQFKILLLDPNSPFAAHRANDLAHKESYVSDQISIAIDEFENLCQEEGVAIEVRVYNSLPSIQQFICDERIFVGFFLHGERSDLNPQLEIAGENTLLGNFFREEFNRVWESAEVRVSAIVAGSD